MLKKRAAIILAIILVIAITLMAFFIQKGRKTLLADPYRTVSGEACIVIESMDLKNFLNSLTTGKGIFGETNAIKEFSAFSKRLKYITDKLNEPHFSRMTTETPAVISFYNSKPGKLNVLLSMAVPGNISERHIKQIFTDAGIGPVVHLTRGGQASFCIPFNNSADTAYMSCRSGLFLLSNSGKVLDGAILQTMKDGDIRNVPGFSRVLMASGSNEDKLFIVFPNLRNLIFPALKDEESVRADRITRIADIAEGDIYTSEEGVILSGYTEVTDTSESLYRYKSLSPGEFRTYRILPESTGMFETIRIKPEKVMDKSEYPVSERLFNLASALREYLGDEITRAYIDIRERPVAENTLIIYKLENPSMAEQVFIREVAADREVIWFEPDEQVKIPVYKTSFSGLINAYLPGFASGVDDSYFAFYDSYMITGSSFVTISRLLYDNILNNTVAYNLNYRDFESTLPSRGSYYLFFIPSRIIPWLSGILDDDIVEFLKSNKSSVNKIRAAGYQLSASNEMIYNSLSLRFKAEADEESTTEWETLLDTTAAIKPFFFTNHNTGSKEIFVQDLKNNAYLINAAGRILWKVSLNERIWGNVFMIDYYRNGKYQLLFSGKNYLHLLDRNGNYVERFPVKLRSPATNSLALFDYDNNLNYRILIAGEDRNIYAYEKSGNVVKGWKPFRTPGVVRSPVSHFQVSGKDYLVACDETTIVMLDRSGNRRGALKQPARKALNSALRLSTGSDSYLVCTAPDGTVQQISFDGAVSTFNLGKFSPEHSFDVFDMDGDGMDEYVFIDQGKLFVFDHTRSELFSRDLKSTRLGGPLSFVFSPGNRKIGVFDSEKNLIYLIDKYGETMEGFPLRGASMFSIGRLSEKISWNLIVGGTDRFLYNYRLETD